MWAHFTFPLGIWWALGRKQATSLSLGFLLGRPLVGTRSDSCSELGADDNAERRTPCPVLLLPLCLFWLLCLNLILYPPSCLGPYGRTGMVLGSLSWKGHLMVGLQSRVLG